MGDGAHRPASWAIASAIRVERVRIVVGRAVVDDRPGHSVDRATLRLGLDEHAPALTVHLLGTAKPVVAHPRQDDEQQPGAVDARGVLDQEVGAGPQPAHRGRRR